jgi:uncharacterized protein (DUF1778 family)
MAALRMARVSNTRSEKLDLRLTPSAKRLQNAAQVTHQSVSEFVLESALARANETLLDRQQFGLSAEQWAAFQAALDAPPRSLPRMSALLREPGVFERGL